MIVVSQIIISQKPILAQCQIEKYEQTHAYIHTYICTHTDIFMNIFMCMFVCVYVCVFALCVLNVD